jgi:gluconolactonase
MAVSMGESYGIRGDFRLHDARFRSVVPPNGFVEKLYTGARWAEGPVYFPAGDFLLFSDIPNNRILRWVPDGAGTGRVLEFRRPSNFTNGNTRDGEGRLLSCEHGTRCVSRTGHDGRRTVLASSFQGKKLNSPNDLVAGPDGAVWFSDPSYGILSDYEGYAAQAEYGGRHVFRIDLASGRLDAVATDFVQPNGLAFSPDGTCLYIADSGASHDPEGPRHIRSFQVSEGKLRGGEVFATVDAGVPDGLRVDVLGNVWTSAGDGVHCFTSRGELLGKILLPEPAANLEFGGPRGNRLFITATTSLYACYLATCGAWAQVLRAG